MPKVVDLEQAKVDRLAGELMPAVRDAFASQGCYVARVAELDDVDRWRRAARKCARQLGVSARTGLSTDGSTVWIVDNSSPTPEQRSDAVRALSEALHGPSRPRLL